MARYGVADFESSVKALKKAQQRTEDKRLLAQIALLLGANYQVLGRDGEARRAFRAALSHDPDLTVDPTRFKRKVIDAVERERKLLARQKPPATAPTSAPATQPTATTQRVVEKQPRKETPPPKTRSRLWTWISAGAALASLGAGIAFGLSAEADYDIYRAEDTHPLRGMELADRIEDKALAANLLFAAAGALAITSVVLFFFEGGEGRDQSQQARPRLGAVVSPAGLVVSGCF